MEKKIIIKKSETADTRTCDWSKVSKEQLLDSSLKHIDDVRKGFGFFTQMIGAAAQKHDFTKLNQIDKFHSDFITGFKNNEWWEMHQQIERHHFNKDECVQDDVNLIDVLEMLIDGIMAGMARSGKYDKKYLPENLDKLLLKSFMNTIDLLLKNIEITDKGN